MEAVRPPRTKKSRSKKKQPKTTHASEQRPPQPSHVSIDAKESNIEINELHDPHVDIQCTATSSTVPEDGDSFNELDAEPVSKNECGDDSELPSTHILGDDDAEVYGTPMNNLDYDSERADDFLRKSQLNVFDCDEDAAKELTYSENVSVDESPGEQYIVEDQEQVEQLYPSLDDDFYQGLQTKSSIFNRSFSQLSCYNMEEGDMLSMQTAEAQLNNIENYIEDEVSLDGELQSFEVVRVIDGEACVDNQSIISECTVHHLSLQTLTYNDNFEEMFQNCYHSNCVTPTHFSPNYEDLNREMLANELKTFYRNPQLQMNEEFLKDFFSMCENPTHEFHLLLKRYQTSRQSFLSHNSVIQSNISKCGKTEENIWTFSKEKKVEYGYCADHMKVTYSENCSKSHCHQEILKDMGDNLSSVHEACNVPLALLQYNWKIDFYHVEQFLVKLVQSCPPLYTITDAVTSYIPDVMVSWEHVNQTSQLRFCISILFYFKRQKSNDEVFHKDIDRWLNILVGLLLRIATLLDHRFLLNHLLRCPTGFSFWGTPFLQFVWSENTYNRETIIGNPIIDHFLLMYLTLISPLSERDKMLVNYEPPAQDSDPTEWALLDELGEVTCDEKQLLERDYLELLGQFNFGMFYRELLKYPTPEEFMKNRQKINEEEVMTLLSMCLKCITFIKSAYSHLDFTRYRNFCQRNAKIMTTFVRFTSDFCYFYEGYGGKYERFSTTADNDHNKLITLHDYVFQEGFRCLAETSNVSLWQFLADLPFHRVSIKILWKLYGFLHQVNPEKHIKSTILREGSAYDIITKLYKTARFQKRLESLSDEDITFMVNVFCKMALSREIDDNFIKVIGLDIYHIGVTASTEKQSTDHACKNCLSSIIDHCPGVVSVIIHNIERPTLKDLPNNLKIFRGLSLLNWLPADEDLILLSTWLQSTSITSLTNQLSRIIIKNLNWSSHKNKLFIPCDVHRQIAVIIVASHSNHLPDRPGYMIHSSGPDFAKHVSNSDKNMFVYWCWEVLLMLCLHKTDLHDHDCVNLKLAKQLSRQLKKQRSESSGRSEQSAGSEPQNEENDVPGPSAGCSFVGKWGKFPYKMRKETGLDMTCEALRTNGEMAAFVALSITTIGHVIVDFQADGMQLLLLLQKNNHTRAMIQILTNLLTITMKSKCLHLMLQLPDFVPLVLSIAKAEYSLSIHGRSTRPLTGFITSHMVSAYKTSQQEGNLNMKFWVHLLFSTPNFHCEPSIVLILDKMLRVLFRYGGDEKYLEEQLRLHLHRVTEAAKRNSSKIMSIMSWFSSSVYITSLLQHLTTPGDVFWWSYYVTKMECEPQHTSAFFQTLTEVLLTHPELTIDYAVRRAQELTPDKEAVNNLSIPSVAIYRWGALLSTIPMDHVLLPYAWREFFKLYFHRPAPETAGVGYRFYQGMFQARDLRAMKQRLQETSKYFELDETEETITDSMLFNSKLSLFFLSLSLWADETRLHEANLYVPGLPQQYSGAKLTDIIQGREAPWDDMIDMVQLDALIEADTAEWSKYTARKYIPHHIWKEEETGSYLVDLLYSYVSKNQCEAVPPPVLVIPQSHIPPIPVITDEDPMSLISIVGPYFSKLKSHAEKFVEQTTSLSNLNMLYLDEMPNMYYNRSTTRTELVACYSRIGPLGRCSGPAPLSITATQYHENPSVIESISDNRTIYSQVLAKCREELDNDVCITAMFIENIVSDLYHTASLHQPLGRKLFYHVVENLTPAVWKYPPSQQIFAFSIDCLGQFFIRNNPEETVNLLNRILSQAEFATVLAPLFQPNQGYEHFVGLYSHVIRSVCHCQIDVGFTILSKFDIRSWLTTPYSTIENSKLLLDTVFIGFDIYPFSETDTTLLMFYDTLKLHLRHVLSNRLCGLIQYTIEKVLEISLKYSHHQQIWVELIDVLELEHSQQVLTLSACHRVLYEISKYFLQFKKSILKAASHDLYSHWHAYMGCFVELSGVLCSTYINKASFLGYQQARPSHPLNNQIAAFAIDGARQRQKSLASDEQASCIFTMTCAVFGPWVLVFEESCLPWAEEGLEEANNLMSVFCNMLVQIDTHIEDTTPLLDRLWWYYMEMLGHPIVPPHIISTYYTHLITLPWSTFTPTLDILHSMLRCVRNNRSNINFVIYLMTQINWQTVVVELEKESHAFDMLIDVLITFALSNDIFFKFGQDFIALFRKFKMLDLSLVSDEGFSSIMSRIDKTVQHNQHLQSVTNTGHLIQFMGSLCRFKHHDSSYSKHITYFKHVVNIISKIANPEYSEILAQSLLYNIEQVFYTSSSEEHIVALSTGLFDIFNKAQADNKTHYLTVKKIETALKDKGSVKEGFSFSQLSLYYLSALTQSVNNTKAKAQLCEVLIESYFIHCENTYPVLSVSWKTIHEHFLLSQMSYESFINHSVTEGSVLNLYLYTHHLLASAMDMDQKYSAVAMLVNSTSRIIPRPREEQKILLLWYKIFDMLIELHNNGIRSSAISSVIKQLPVTMLKLAEDREASGIFGTPWFGKKSKFSLEFRMIARIVATYVLHQLNKDGSLRTTPTRHNITSDAGKAMDNVRALVNNKAYAAHISTLQHCMSMILDTTQTFLHVRHLIRFLAVTCYDDTPYLSEIFYLKNS